MDAAQIAGGRFRRSLAGLAALAALLIALAVPGLASAHPQVYKLTPNKQDTGIANPCNHENNPTGTCVVPNPAAPRYAIANDGYARTLTETAGSNNPGHGIINYQLIPGGYRKWETAPKVTKQMTGEQLIEFAEDHSAVTEVQPHATCSTAALNETDTILAWQGPAKAATPPYFPTTEPFFDYIPWQRDSAGLGDEPDKWIPVVEDVTGVDLSALSTEAEFKAACEALPGPGVYYKADAGSNPATNAIADAVAAAEAPLEGEIAGLLGEKSTLQGQIDAWVKKGAGLGAEKAALAAQVASLGGEKAGLEQQVSGLKKTNANKGRTIKKLRKQLKAARNG